MRRGTHHVRKLKGKTTGLTVILPQRKQRYILTYPGTMHEMSLKDLDLSYVSAPSICTLVLLLHKALRPDMIELFRRAKAAGPGRLHWIPTTIRTAAGPRTFCCF